MYLSCTLNQRLVTQRNKTYRAPIVVAGSCRICSSTEFSGLVMPVMPEEVVVHCPGVEMVQSVVSSVHQCQQWCLYETNHGIILTVTSQLPQLPCSCQLPNLLPQPSWQVYWLSNFPPFFLYQYSKRFYLFFIFIFFNIFIGV